MSLIQSAVDRSRTVLFTLAFIMIAGLMTFVTIPKESAPDIKIPIINISYTHDGISPEEGERLILQPLEQSLSNLEGVKEMRATSRENKGTLTLEFNAGFDSKKALDNVREKVSQAKSKFPENTDEPIIKEVSFSEFPVLIVHLSGPLPKRALYKIAKDLQDSLEGSISSILEANIVGDQLEAVEIIVHPSKLEKYNFNFQNIVTLFQRNNLLASAGNIDNGKGSFSLKINGLMSSVDDMLMAPVGVFENRIVRFQDVAEIRRTYKDALGYARLNGNPSVSLEISKRAGENIIDTIKAIKSQIKEEQGSWPQSLRVDFTQDESKKINDMLDDLENSVIAAVLMVMFVIVVSLGWRSSLLVGLAVPGSFLMGILFLAFQGYTLNIVVLFALILSVGMLVDGAIIVAEYADRQMVKGLSPKDAFIVAAQRMTWPVISSTITIIVAFLPLLFWPGIIGQFMRFLPLTLIATLTGSIAMALIFLPSLGMFFGKRPLSGQSEAEAWYIQKYRIFLSTALDHPGRVLKRIAGFILFIIVLYGLFNRGTEFFPALEPTKMTLQVRAQGNLSVDERAALVHGVEDKIKDMNEIQNVYSNTVVGSASSKRSAPAPEDTIGTIMIELVDWQERRPAKEIIQEINDRTLDLPGIHVQTNAEKNGPQSSKPISLEISSKDPSLMLQSTRQLRQFLNALEGLTNIEDTLPVPGFEWAVRVNREKAALYGVSVADVSQGIRMISNGLLIDKYRPYDSRDEIDILLRYPRSYRNLTSLQTLKIQSQRGLVPIASFTTQGFQPKLDVINRVDQNRVYQLTADILPGTFAANKIKEIQAWVKKNPLPSGVTLRFKGEDKDTNETKTFLVRALGVALFLITLILVTQFNSFFSTGLVLSAVLLSTIGVLVGLLITGKPFNIVMGGIGVIALGGIIVSNNIIFIDTFDQLRKTSNDMKKNIIDTATTRIRPIILTHITTVLGLMPMALKITLNFYTGKVTHGAPTSLWWVDLSLAIVFGVSFATVLTLIVTPCALMIRENYRLKKAIAKSDQK